MSLLRNVGTIGGLTLVSRVFGFARDMLLARVLGAGGVADAWQLAFQLPNIFRRLFAEGAFARPSSRCSTAGWPRTNTPRAALPARCWRCCSRS
jgi:hypothetical protein